MNQLRGSAFFLILGAATAACGSGSSAFTSGDPSGGASGSGGAAGNSSAGTGNGSAGTGNGSAGTGNGSAGTGNGSAGTAGSGAGVGGTSAGGAGGSSAGAGGSPMCPAPTGYYTTIMTEGVGCGDYDSSVPVCASAGAQDCNFSVKGDSDKSLDGSLVIQANGAFEGAMVMEGSAPRSGCVGMFAPESGILTIACGGTDTTSKQFCRIKLTRTANVCP